MARYSKSQDNDLSFIFTILVGAAAWQHKAQLVRIAYVALALTVIALLLSFLIRRLPPRRNSPIDIDFMTGLEFEHYIAGLLRENGFRKVKLTERYDFGVDIIAEKDEVRWGIQVKRHEGMVKANAVRQVVTALRLYGCDREMVITSSTYSKVAQRLALANDCVLVDRKGLLRLNGQKCIL